MLKDTIYILLKEETTFAVILNAIMNEYYGDTEENSWYEWDPTTIWLELKDDFGANIDVDILDKISAVQVVMMTDGFFKRAEVFSSVCNTFTSGSPSFTVFDPLEPVEVVWGIVELAMLRDFLPFTDNLKGLMQVVFDGQPVHPIVKYCINTENPESRIIINMVSELLESPQGDIDEFIVDQVADLLVKVADIPLLADKIVPDKWRG